MATVTIDGVEYELDALSEEAKAQISSIQATDVKIAQAQQDIAIFQTAKNTYSQALREMLESSDD